MSDAIPKIIHQIWLGSNPRPVPWIKTVKDFCHTYGYKYMIWSDKSIEALGIDEIPGLRGIYTGQKELAGKADIIRLLALYTFGGVYIDADTVIMKPAKFHAFLEANRAAVFFGWEELSSARSVKVGKIDGVFKKRLVANGLIGSLPKHAFIRTLLERVVANAKSESGEDAWKQVGPLLVTRVYEELKDWFPDVHVYPMKYFYPIHWGGLSDPEHHLKVKIPAESMLFQYGYSTNSFDRVFWESKNL
jgi:mannosyltransferase OCH1-like enzyme